VTGRGLLIDEPAVDAWRGADGQPRGALLQEELSDELAPATHADLLEDRIEI
jgi:hypothetical protein